MRLQLVVAIAGVAALACAPAAPAAPSSPPPTAAAPAAPAATPTSAPTVAPTAVPTVAATATPTAVAPPAQPPAFPGQEQFSGKVAAIGGGQITLDSGKSYTLAANTRFSHPVIKSYTDLKKGDFVAITAQLDPADSSLKASQVVFFPPGSTVPPGQRPLASGLMTNATVDSIDATGFTAAFGAGAAKVKMAPGGVVFSTEPGNIEAVKVGMMITTVVANGGAVSIFY
ncbi:MAG: DUF5666 domain-containing protein [Chloroflexi bacterium]|nr:DUF5666 domain-containing protein [Chloroflexota bacterium]